MQGSYLKKGLHANVQAKLYSSLSSGLLSRGKREVTHPIQRNHGRSTDLAKLTQRNTYNTYKNRVFNPGMYNNVPPNYMNMQMNSHENNVNSTQNGMSLNYENQSNRYYPLKYNYGVNAEGVDNNAATSTSSSATANTTYQYFSIFGNSAMCLIKPIYPDYIVNKNKVTIYGKGGFQFVFMKKHINSNKYDKNNKMSVILKINSLAHLLSLKDAEQIKVPIIIKGSNSNSLIIDKHKEKKDHIVIRYKYQPFANSDGNMADMNNLDMEVNQSPQINNLNDEKKNNFEELHVSCPFSEFQLFQKAANLLLPQLLGWARHH
ncbi:conserved Plasmodium protein, unknown function [Plasmodium knowlesi strain H]|uniref:Uncharacterized protein n=3 Tax=Plasmodium knowlesi TaxID=5850 RepID=A0A5K1UPI8_PLAKH|nr:single-stranded DNA-binding protein, putative [Plasmodium knowlesi strain H]OTN67068.1 Uncharacterized protein PKNOH_S07450600 [Plasmodium knowlesi]CAA9988633.1 single-stranded DNA-binding protein, putative [Plasmodium knowlesi strain H]SBO21483.1 conserved Plasmodium protein, unknown function [Plasmodium knowlesi strain H]SBO21907.1 conserved Plasmodium protein, unknown function [Plasmodium knowlesi strain H]VVS78107.1 single-stranded DNA-binding protein, putative [Plasmodium knowlesi stra|eukprot:XP_002259609.1 hypothetical protein, conserved in Plasmodium species [Plasmodium knowlesi strain H]